MAFWELSEFTLTCNQRWATEWETVIGKGCMVATLKHLANGNLDWKHVKGRLFQLKAGYSLNDE
jgi:hypothetical protein